MLLLLLLSSYCLFEVNATVTTVTSGNWESVIESALQPGDEVIFPDGVYATSSNLEVTWIGTSANRIIIRAQNIGGATIHQTDSVSRNLFNIRRGEFFDLKGLRFRGGDLGLRLGSSSSATDTVHDALFEDLEIFETQGSMLTANTGSGATVKQYFNNVFRRLYMHNPLGTGTNECMYLGCNQGGLPVTNCQFHDNMIEWCRCEDTMLPNPSQGEAYEIKSGSYGNTVRYNTAFNVQVGVFFYDTWDLGSPNIAYGNVIGGTTDNGIQVTAGARVYNNLIFDSGNNGIQIGTTQLLPGSAPRDFHLIHNTVLRSNDRCLRGNGLGSANAATVLIYNNIFGCPGATAIGMGSANNGNFGGNVHEGSLNAGTTVTYGTTAVTITNVLENSMAVADYNAFPDPPLDATTADTGNPAPNGLDWNCNTRTIPTTIGAYARLGAASNPGATPAKGSVRQSCTPTTPAPTTPNPTTSNPTTGTPTASPAPTTGTPTASPAPTTGTPTTGTPTTGAPTASPAPTTGTPTTGTPTTGTPTTSTPTVSPASPTKAPTTRAPSVSPTKAPSSSSPTGTPSSSTPTSSGSSAPTTAAPSKAPTASNAPSASPTVMAGSPTKSPTTPNPTNARTSKTPTTATTSGSPTSPATTAPPNSNIGAIIGGAIGGVIVIVAIIVGAILCHRHRSLSGHLSRVGNAGFGGM